MNSEFSLSSNRKNVHKAPERPLFSIGFLNLYTLACNRHVCVSLPRMSEQSKYDKPPFALSYKYQVSVKGGSHIKTMETR